MKGKPKLDWMSLELLDVCIVSNEIVDYMCSIKK